MVADRRRLFRVGQWSATTGSSIVKHRGSSPLKPILAAAILVAFTGCAGQARNPFSNEPDPREGQVRVSVDNQNFGDATVHALRGGERIRLGEVTGKTEKDFTVRWTVSFAMEFEIRLVGGGSCGIRGFAVDPGDRVHVTIPTEISPNSCFARKV
jgi:hypothetical protein